MGRTVSKQAAHFETGWVANGCNINNTVTVSERALATLYVGMGPVFSVLGGFDTPETHIRHFQKLILITEIESSS